MPSFNYLMNDTNTTVDFQQINTQSNKVKVDNYLSILQQPYFSIGSLEKLKSTLVIEEYLGQEHAK